MPVTLQAALLGIVQGLTEFLPVSSSAHLILARAFFGFDADRFGLAFDVACHVGTLMAVLVYFRREIVDMVTAVPRLMDPGRDENARMIWLLVIGTLPAIAAGLLFKREIEVLRTPLVAAVTLALGSILFFVAERRGSKARSEQTLTMPEAVWIGCAQALALVPGVSRSGATISMALLLGLGRPDAARFIFLLSIPAILGAAVGEVPDLLKAGGAGGTALLFVIGVITSAIVGYATVKFFIRYLAKRSLDAFAWYRIALAAATVMWVLT